MGKRTNGGSGCSTKLPMGRGAGGTQQRRRRGGDADRGSHAASPRLDEGRQRGAGGVRAVRTGCREPRRGAATPARCSGFRVVWPRVITRVWRVLNGWLGEQG